MTYGVELKIAERKTLKSARSLTGSFSHRFLTSGTYHYSSGSVDPAGAIVMDGKVVVQPLRSTVSAIKLKVSGTSNHNIATHYLVTQPYKRGDQRVFLFCLKPGETEYRKCFCTVV